MSLNRSDAHQRDRGPAPAHPRTDFSPAAVMARARAYAAERAAELAASPPRPDGRSGAEILAAIEAGLAPAEPPRPAPAGGRSGEALLDDMAHTIDGGRP